MAHLTGRGRKRIGDTLADVLMREYDLWRIDNPEIFWTPEESVSDPTGDLWQWECDNPEPSRYELMMNALEEEDVCKFVTQNTKLCWTPLLLLSSVVLGLGFKSQMGRLLQLPNELPAQTCADAQDNGLYYGESIATPPPGPDPLPFPKGLTVEPPTKLPTITLKGSKYFCTRLHAG